MGAVASEDGLTRLGNETIGALPAGIVGPNYDRGALRPGILHIGVGNFHRAHQAWYLHRLMQTGKALDWAIIGAGVRPYDAGMRERLLGQDCLTTLLELDPNGRSAEVVGAMINYLPIEDGNRALIAQMADPAIRIVALTVTESAYYIDPVTKGFDASHPEIQYDAAHPERPRTAFGAMVAALKLRRARGHGPFTGQSCDNLIGNGRVLRQTVVSLARMSDPDLADWIGETCSFPNSMVDCIVPATGPKELALAREFGVDDAAPVAHENFRQWVVEDDFCAGRPDWDAVGATFSDDVHSYELMKLRILNAGHQVVANPGEILSLNTIADCMQHTRIAAFFRKVETEEIAPRVAPVPGMAPLDYVALIDRRFSNPYIEDTTRRVAFDGAARHTGFVLPMIREALEADGPLEGLALTEALWARMCEGTREDGSTIEPNDPQWETLTATAKAARSQPRAWIDARQLYGDLAEAPRFAEAFERWLALIWSKGVETALDRYIAG